MLVFKHRNGMLVSFVSPNSLLHVCTPSNRNPRKPRQHKNTFFFLLPMHGNVKLHEGTQGKKKSDLKKAHNCVDIGVFVKCNPHI